jgi:hypothetical protein
MWQIVKFQADEVEPGQPSELFQFNFSLMCAEIMQEEGGLWVGTLLDEDGDEVWLSTAVDFSYQAKYLVREHLRECFAQWLNEMSVELP